MNTILRRTLASVLALLTSGTIALVTASPAAAQPDGFYSVPYSGTVYRHYHDDAWGFHYPVTFQEWVDAGRPTPRAVPTSFVKYPWSSTIYAVSFFDNASDQWEWRKVTFSEWSRAGKPAPRTAGWIEGSTYHQWATSSEVFVELDGQVHRLTFNQWKAAGSPSPRVQADSGFMKLSWNSSIAYMLSIGGGQGYPVNLAEWRAEGSPTPKTQRMLPGDYVCSYSWTDELWYDGSSYYGALSYEQWKAAGFPSPVPCG
ncbi:hypothetical protein [Cellulosimicrobium sp. NPDC057862]|uniref:hypothetical protein n=1 Tax=Cellulosimicrobium sp. NPDC057862 TaxID=3346266 RepID=UPI00367045F6